MSEILDESAVSEIEARYKLASKVFPYREVNDSLDDIPALCATVKHLRELADTRSDLIAAKAAHVDQLQSQLEQLRAENERLREETLKGVCVYCGYVETYQSLEQKDSDEGNAMRVAHIRQCKKRPELRLIAELERLMDKHGKD